MMADISKCRDDQCPSRDRCYRFTATPSEYQWFADFAATRKAADKCSSFWPVEERK